MPEIRRTNLCFRTRNAASQRYTRASQTDEQREARTEVGRNRWNRKQEHINIAFNPYRAAFNYNVGIDYSLQQIVAREPLHSLVSGNGPDSKHFLTHIQEYNNCNYNVEIDYSSQQIVAIGPMNVVRQYCKAFKFKNEADGLCCASGQVKLTPLVPPQEPLHSLVSGIGPDSKHFLTHIQQYNNCFQMTSFGAKKVIQENFIPTFKLQGQI